MDLNVFLAWQLAVLPMQMLLFLGIHQERRRMQSLLRFAVIKLQQSRR